MTDRTLKRDREKLMKATTKRNIVKAPKLLIEIEPMENNKAMYLPLAPAQAGQSGHAMIVLRLRLTNTGSTDVVVTKIRYSFPRSSVAAVDMKGVPLQLNPDGITNPSQAKGKIKAGQTATWSNGRVDLDPSEDGENFHDNMIYLKGTPPSKIRVEVFCQGFRHAATVAYPLAPYTSPTPKGAFSLPFSAGDLRDGEYIVTSSYHWANGGAFGTQIYALDVGIEGTHKGNWSSLLPGKPGTKNDSYRIWDKPVRAMADGVVEDFSDGMIDNTVLGEFPEPTPDPVGGNHIWIKHGDVSAVYTHLRKGTIPKKLKKIGAKVSVGQVLGRAGNSGNSSNPHIHLEIRKGSKSGPLRGIPFRNAMVLDHDGFTPPSPNDPWVELKAQGIPKNEVSIWPTLTIPGFKILADGPVSVVSRAPNKLDVFALGGDGQVYTAAWQNNVAGGIWQGWWPIKGLPKSPFPGIDISGAPVSVVSRDPNKLDIFVTAGDGRIYTAAWDKDVANGAWRGWWPIKDLKAEPGTPVSVVARTSTNLDVFVTGKDGRVYTAAWDHKVADGKWQGWWPINGLPEAPIPGIDISGAAVSAVSRDPNKLDIFVTAIDGRVYTAAWDHHVADGKWRGWWKIKDLQVDPKTPVSVVARTPTNLDVFTTGKDGRVYTAAWDPKAAGGKWQGWWPINGLPTSPIEGLDISGALVSAVSRGANKLDIFVTAIDGKVYTAAWDHNVADGKWRGWWPIKSLKAGPTAPVSAVSRDAEKLDIFVTAKPNLPLVQGKAVYTAAWDHHAADGEWQGWWPIRSVGG